MQWLRPQNFIGINYVVVIDWLTRNYGSKRSESEGAARGRGLLSHSFLIRVFTIVYVIVIHSQHILVGGDVTLPVCTCFCPATVSLISVWIFWSFTSTSEPAE